MDCAAEEQLIRLALDGAVARFAVDLPRRELTLWHAGPLAPIEARLLALGFGGERLSSAPAADAAAPPAGVADERRVLRTLLAINAAMFGIELFAGWRAESSGLVADALDMFADAAVYGVALLAVGHGAGRRLGAARLAGGLQLLLALGLFAQVGWRLVHGAEPLAGMMMGVALLALAANLACLLLLHRHRGGGAHLRASYLFSANDVLANLGVVVAGGLVAWLGAAWPDWLIGSLIGALVLAGALKILRLRED
ncbi:MAG TPA: cation transporter [Azospira sp.]|nr:cation transporter [Azospira sp.]